MDDVAENSRHYGLRLNLLKTCHRFVQEPCPMYLEAYSSTLLMKSQPTNPPRYAGLRHVWRKKRKQKMSHEFPLKV
jgi:hypothetical protein